MKPFTLPPNLRWSESTMNMQIAALFVTKTITLQGSERMTVIDVSEVSVAVSRISD